MANAPPPLFADQSKPRGRKPKKGVDKKAATGGKASKATKKAAEPGAVEQVADSPPEPLEDKPAKKRAPRKTSTAKGKKRSSGAGNAAECAPEAAETNGAEDSNCAECYTPPSHVKLNGVYSSAYYKAKSMGLGKEQVQERARQASKLFKEKGLVNHLCGTFKAAPKTSGKKPRSEPKEAPNTVAPEQQAADASM